MEDSSATGSADDLRELLDHVDSEDPKETVVSLDEALLDESGTVEFLVPTGLGGRLRIVAEDPQDPTLLARYLDKATSDPEGARAELWDACVIEPAKLSEKQSRLTTSFKNGLDDKLMRLAGFDFFMDTLRKKRREIERILSESSTVSQDNTPVHPTKFEDGAQSTSPTPTLTLSSENATSA